MSRRFFSRKCLGSRTGFSRRDWLLLAAAGWCGGVARGDELRQLSPQATPVPAGGLNQLISKMRKIVEKRDYRALELLMAPTFRVEFDAGKGPRDFDAHWLPASSTSLLWDVLGQLLSMEGNYYSKSLYVVPFVYARFPIDLDPLGHVVAVRENAELFAEPRADGQKVGTLNYSIVPLATPMAIPVILRAGGYIEVMHPEFGRCFVASADVYHPSAHRAFFERRNGKWQWISLAAATLADPPELRLHRKGP